MNIDTIVKATEKVTKKWHAQKKREERRRQESCNRSMYMSRSYRATLRDAAFKFMAQAYTKASGGGRLPALARQVMYAARPLVQAETGQRLGDKYFTQDLLPEYMKLHPEKTAAWDVAYDARGTFIEPHAKFTSAKPVKLGTLEVRDYLIRTRTVGSAAEMKITMPMQYPTCGPENRYSAILFIEKEGFFPLFEEVQLAERYDIAIMSTKGMSVIAARRLIDDLCGQHEIPVLVVHDFDSHGIVIAGTLTEDTDRYEFTYDIEVIDLGLRLNDVETYSLQTEAATGRISAANLRSHGATEEEVQFLESSRVELNAFASDQLIEWLEANGITKVIPDDDVLADAVAYMARMCRMETAIAKADTGPNGVDASVFDGLGAKLRDALADDPTRSWDDVLHDIVYEHVNEQDEA